MAAAVPASPAVNNDGQERHVFYNTWSFYHAPVDRAGGQGAESWLGQFIHPTMKGNSMQYQASHNLNHN